MLQFAEAFAVFFIIWWMTLFVVLPIGIRTQAENRDVVPGSVESAPADFRFGRALLITTLVSAAIYGAWLIASLGFGISLESFPHIVPDFR